MQNVDASDTDSINHRTGGTVTFTVIIPVYNVEPYLARCLDSVIPALGAEDEIVLSLEASGSDDATDEIAEQYAKKYANIRTIRHDVKGPSDARNCAVREARGTYIVYVDGDDRVDTQLFAKVLQNIRIENEKKVDITERTEVAPSESMEGDTSESTAVDISESATEVSSESTAGDISENMAEGTPKAAESKTSQSGNLHPYDLYIYDFYCDNRLTGKLEPHFQIGEGGDLDGIDQIQRMLKRRGAFWHICRFIFRREFLRQHDITFPDGSMGEDLGYITSVLAAEPVTAFRHDPYYIYMRYRGDSLMDGQTLQRLRDVVSVLQRSIYRMRKATLTYSACVVDRFQYEYILNMALIYEIEEKDRAAGRRLFYNAVDVLAGSGDTVVRLVRQAIRIVGIDVVAYMLHIAKLMRRKMKT